MGYFNRYREKAAEGTRQIPGWCAASANFAIRPGIVAGPVHSQLQMSLDDDEDRDADEKTTTPISGVGRSRGTASAVRGRRSLRAQRVVKRLGRQRLGVEQLQ